MANGKVALVTGGGGGVGQAVVLRLLRDGFTVAAMDINQKSLDEVKGRATSHAAALSLWPCDQTDEKATVAVVAAVEKKLGPVEALVNTIGWVGTTRFEDGFRLLAQGDRD